MVAVIVLVTVKLPLLPLMTPLGNVAVTFDNSLPSPCSKPNEPVEVAEPLTSVSYTHLTLPTNREV